MPGCCWRTQLFAERIAHFLAHWSFRVIAGFSGDQAVLQRRSRASLTELSMLRPFKLWSDSHHPCFVQVKNIAPDLTPVENCSSGTHQTGSIQIRWSERMMFPALQSTVASAASARRVKMRVSHPTDTNSPGEHSTLIPSDLPLEKNATVSWPLSWILQLR